MASILHFIWPIPDKGLDRRIYRVSAPTLLVWGKQDASSRRCTPRSSVGACRTPSLEVFDDAGHIPQLEQPEPVAEAVRAFLS